VTNVAELARQIRLHSLQTIRDAGMGLITSNGSGRRLSYSSNSLISDNAFPFITTRIVHLLERI